MTKARLLRLLMRMLTVVTLGAAGGTSQAAIYVGAWDPQFQFTGAFASLGYQGKATFFVPDSCLATDGIKADAVCDSSFLNGFVQLYRFPNSGNILATANFGPQSPDPVLAVNIVNGELVGIDTGLIGFQLVTVADNLGTIYAGPVWLDFDIGTTGPPGLVFLWLGSCEGFEILTCTPTLKAEIPGIVRFTRVPEPGTVGLLFGALGAVWLGRRRLLRAQA